MIELSIILPTYNTPENKFRRCLTSIYNQISESIEVIVVDDGSTEFFSVDLKKLKDEFKFILIEQENKGVSAARNQGISKSHGQYIMFVDADDSLQTNSIKNGLELVKKYDADMVLGGINIVRNGKTSSCVINQNQEFVCCKAEIDMLQKYMLAIRCDKRNNVLNGFRCTGPWAKIIKKDIIKEIRFDEKLQIYEDLLFNLAVLDQASKVVVDTHVWYDYYIYSNSAIHKYRSNGVEQLEYTLEKLKALVDTHIDLGGAVSIKIIECLGRVFTNTIFHKDNKKKNKLLMTKNILRDSRVNFLLCQFDETNYSFMSKKEKYLWVMFSKEMVLPVAMYYRMKEFVRR